MVASSFLLDVNILLALWVPTQQDHEKVTAWFHAEGSRNWATCPITQAGFVRLASNPALTPDALSVTEALSVLAANLKHPGHVFWADELDLPHALSLCGRRLQGYREITDAYLVALAMHRKGRLVTLDRAMTSLFPVSERGSNRVVDLSARVFRK
jgi:toxin-antitoxin system PIN domain toxin